MVATYFKDFFSKCDQIHTELRFGQISKKSLMRNCIFCAVSLKFKPKEISVYVSWGKSRWKYDLKVVYLNNTGFDEVELLGITFAKALNLRKHIENLCSATQCKHARCSRPEVF